MVSLNFRSNCVIKSNTVTVLPPYWLFSLLFDGTKGIIINKNSNINDNNINDQIITLCACCSMQTFPANFLPSHDA